MNRHHGTIKKIHFDEFDNRIGVVELNLQSTFRLGQYFTAINLDLPYQIFNETLFPLIVENNLVSFSNFPQNWKLEQKLYLQGPIGNGLTFAPDIKKLSMISLGNNLSFLNALEKNFEGEIALFSKQTPKYISKKIEIFPLSAFTENSSWAELNIFEIPQERLENFKTLLSLEKDFKLTSPSQVFISGQYPCGGFNNCNICSQKLGAWVIPCNGPIFDLKINNGQFKLLAKS